MTAPATKYKKTEAVRSFYIWWPRQESNLYFEFRKLMSYPLNDGTSRLLYIIKNPVHKATVTDLQDERRIKTQKTRNLDIQKIFVALTRHALLLITCPVNNHAPLPDPLRRSG